jgi:hypothetical protein
MPDKTQFERSTVATPFFDGQRRGDSMSRIEPDSSRGPSGGYISPDKLRNPLAKPALKP